LAIKFITIILFALLVGCEKEIEIETETETIDQFIGHSVFELIESYHGADGYARALTVGTGYETVYRVGRIEETDGLPVYVDEHHVFLIENKTVTDAYYE